jgi:hypothetical protein
LAAARGGIAFCFVFPKSFFFPIKFFFPSSFFPVGKKKSSTKSNAKKMSHQFPSHQFRGMGSEGVDEALSSKDAAALRCLVKGLLRELEIMTNNCVTQADNAEMYKQQRDAEVKSHKHTLANM